MIGSLTVAIGLYARFEKTEYQDFFNDIMMDPAFALIIVGGIMFIIGFTGCIGALRENVCLLKFVSLPNYENYILIMYMYQVYQQNWLDYVYMSILY